MKSLLLHVCCACCSTSCIERLNQDYDVTLFFSNSNIFPKKEYDKRLEETRKVAKKLGLPLLEDDYCHEKWLESVKGLESEKEGGKRCVKCFEYNLLRVAKVAKSFDFFTTTLTVSPYKNSKTIFNLGSNFSKFLDIDFKKKDGFKRSIELSKEYDLYRQNYCGCEYSKYQ